MLAYSLMEYEGELYRINISESCAGEEKILDYFFVVWGRATVTERKHLMVPSTHAFITIACAYVIT